MKKIKNALLIFIALLLLSGCGSGAQYKADLLNEAEEASPLDSSTLLESEVFGENRVTFLAVGDNIIHEAVFTDARNRADAAHPTYNFVDMYADLADDIASADVAFVNQEAPISSSYRVQGYPDFNSPAEAGQALVELGFDVVNVANNHMLDMGQQGYIDTIDFWNTQDVLTIGGYTEDDFDNIRVLEVNGIKIAFLSYTTLVNFAHANSLSASSGYVIPYAKDATIRRQTEAAKKMADVVIVSMHWGTEDSFALDAQQERLVKVLADCGVDAVIGHHPHVIQKIEEVERSDGGNMLVAYSLGNFISTMHYSQNMLGGMLTFDIVVDSEGNVRLENVLLTPIVTHYSLTRDSLHIYKFEDYTSELAKLHGSTLKNGFTYNILKKYITDNVSPEYLPDFMQ